MSLPSVVEELLVDVVADGFVVCCCGPKTAPNALVACYEWERERYVDLVTIRDFDRITTARVPARDKLDIFAPETVVWVYHGPAQLALRALLDLVHPAHPDAPAAHYPAPASLRVPRAEQRPMTIRLPSPGRAGIRAVRLTTARTTRGPGGSCRDAAVPGGTGDPRPAAREDNPWRDIDGASAPAGR
ncbi:MAG: hypothetical protein ACRDTA_16030 [Pseudonocardiaceae bacterium]